MRPLGSCQHGELRAHIPELNRYLDVFPSTSLKWRPLGKAGLMLMERGEFAMAQNFPGSKLNGKEMSATKARLRAALITQNDQHRMQPAKTVRTSYMGKGRLGLRSIVYMLDPEAFIEDRADVIDTMNEEAGVEIGWRNFKPHVTVATVDKRSATPELLRHFERFRPDSLSFMGVKVEAS